MPPAFCRAPRCGRPAPAIAAQPWSGRGRPPTRPRRSAKHKPVSVKQLALSLPERAWRTVGWREGSRDRLTSASPACACAPPIGTNSQRRVAPDRMARRREGADQVLALHLATRHHLQTSGRSDEAAWRIERDYQELKQELGLGHFEGRSWRGFHHHATLCIAAYGFLISERETIPPSAPGSAARLTQSLRFPPITDPEAPPIRPEEPHP